MRTKKIQVGLNFILYKYLPGIKQIFEPNLQKKETLRHKLHKNITTRQKKNI